MRAGGGVYRLSAGQPLGLFDPGLVWHLDAGVVFSPPAPLALLVAVVVLEFEREPVFLEGVAAAMVGNDGVEPGHFSIAADPECQK